MTATPSAVKAAVLGFPISHSLSPRLHGYWLKHYAIDGLYTAIEVAPERLEETMKSLHAQNFRGVNLTVPHKEKALEILRRANAHITDVAQRIGAVNTIIVHPDGRLEGANTDAFGFTENLGAGGFAPSDRPVTVLGAGGAARSVIAALIDMRCPEIRIVNRTTTRAEALAEEFTSKTKAESKSVLSVYEWGDAHALSDASLLVNTTSLGMKGQDRLDITLDALPTDAFVNDIVYAPLQTDLLIAAQQRGNKTVDGLGMLLHQARPAFAAFFGVDPAVTPELRSYILGTNA
jgi:shikimate dehydrogenase